MNAIKRIFVIGHPGAGKGLFAKELAKTLGWKFVDADFDLEMKIGKSLPEILGESGSSHFHATESNVLSHLKKMENIVVATDAAILCSEENLKILSQEFVVYLKVNVDTQINRTHPNRMRNHTPFLVTDYADFLNELHKERDSLYERAASFCIDTNDSDLDNHVKKTVKIIKQKNVDFDDDNLIEHELVLFHKITHTPVQLNKKQSECLILLSCGKSSKEIADLMHLSSRTIEDHIKKLMEILGCSSSKELIAVYYDQP